MPGEAAARVKVVDASVIAAVLFGEPAAEELGARLGDAPLAAPPLLRDEVASVCVKKIRRHPARRTALLAALDLLARLDLRELQVPAPEVAALALDAKLTVYDAAYLWLARALDAELVTLDATLDRAALRYART
jgi:predicted nucleic acid-binding protein